jgi:excisionase family DNA binding protein
VKRPPAPELSLTLAVTKFAFGREEAADALGVSPTHLDKAIEAGEIETYRDGRRVLIPVEELLKYRQARIDRTREIRQAGAQAGRRAIARHLGRQADA